MSVQIHPHPHAHPHPHPQPKDEVNIGRAVTMQALKLTKAYIKGLWGEVRDGWANHALYVVTSFAVVRMYALENLVAD